MSVILYMFTSHIFFFLNWLKLVNLVIVASFDEVVCFLLLLLVLLCGMMDDLLKYGLNLMQSFCNLCECAYDNNLLFVENAT